jgi:hypothetical protein
MVNILVINFGSFFNGASTNCRIDHTYLKGCLKFIINKYKSQTCITVRHKALPSHVFKGYGEDSFKHVW